MQKSNNNNKTQVLSASDDDNNAILNCFRMKVLLVSEKNDEGKKKRAYSVNCSLWKYSEGIAVIIAAGHAQNTHANFMQNDFFAKPRRSISLVDECDFCMRGIILAWYQKSSVEFSVEFSAEGSSLMHGSVGERKE